MIPVLIGLGVAAAGAAVVLSDDDNNKKNDVPATSRRNVSESYVQQKMQKNGRKIKTVGDYQENFSNFKRVQKIIAEQLDLDDAEVQMSSRIVEDLGADSLDVVELIMALEEEFNMEIPDNVAEKVKTVGDIVNYIDS